MPSKAECLDQVVHARRTDAQDVRLAHHRHQGALGSLARLEQARKAAAIARAPHLELERADARIPGPLAVAVALPAPLATAFVALGADVLGNSTSISPG
jgi:hypothetical protein